LLYLRRGETNQAEADLDVILESGPLVAKRHEIMATRAIARLLQRRTTEATADAAEAQRLKPCPSYQRLWQRALLAAGRYGELQLDRPEEISLLPVGGAWLARDLRAAAKKLPLLARGPRPQATRALLNQAVVLAALGDLQAAARVADRVLELASLSPRAHLICARVFHHVGDRSRALREINLGQAIQPDEPGLLELRGVLRIEAGDAEKAVIDLNRAIAGSPRNFTFLHKAAALVALGNYEGAIHEWTMALRSDPELPSAFLGRARCYVRLSLWDQALADLEQASAWAHDDPGLQLKILSTYARCVVERPKQRERFALLLERSFRQGWDWLTRTSVAPGFSR
jgi:tetratricopeptide (TPR) repeat protein